MIQINNLAKAIIIILLLPLAMHAQDKPDWQNGVPEGCTTITVGRQATFDGSVITSHTDDSHRTRAWMNIVPPERHRRRDKVTMYKREPDDSGAMPKYKHTPIGEIPQVRETFGFINTAYPCMNTEQLAIGESTFGGRETLKSEEGLIDCQRLVRLMLERSTTAREAIKTAGELLKEYGWNDAGECLTIADTKEVWHLEIVGPGENQTGAIWAAQRVPDDEVSVNANAARIQEIDLENEDFFMASDNVMDVARDSMWWNQATGPFRFADAYAPESRESMAARRREWRVLSMMNPNLNLDPEARDYPFSVKPDKKVTLKHLINIFKDYYEETPYHTLWQVLSCHTMRTTFLIFMADGATWVSEQLHVGTPCMPPLLKAGIGCPKRLVDWFGWHKIMWPLRYIFPSIAALLTFPPRTNILAEMVLADSQPGGLSIV
jgi:dipeptidase